MFRATKSGRAGKLPDWGEKRKPPLKRLLPPPPVNWTRNNFGSKNEPADTSAVISFRFEPRIDQQPQTVARVRPALTHCRCTDSPPGSRICRCV